MNDFTKWAYDETPRNENIKISDDGLYNYITFFKNCISLLAVVFPNMIINKQMKYLNYDDIKHWNISDNHYRDIMDMISNYYAPVEKFYGNSTINNILYEIKNKCRGIYLLSETTPILTNIKIHLLINQDVII